MFKIIHLFLDDQYHFTLENKIYIFHILDQKSDPGIHGRKPVSHWLVSPIRSKDPWKIWKIRPDQDQQKC